MTRDRRTEVADRAYEIWENEGRPHGNSLDHWLRAETELRGALQEVVASPQLPHRQKKLRESAPATRTGTQLPRRPRTGQSPPKGIS